MTITKQWLRITPLDTMFFKGSEPMIAGVSHEVRTVFPPLPTTLLGAIRSAVLGQRSIDPYQYTGGGHEEIVKQYPLLGTPETPGFRLAGPFFEVTTARSREVLLPAPAHWHGDLDEADNMGIVEVAAAEPAIDLLASVGLCGSAPNPLWLLDPSGRRGKSVSGWWTNGAAIEAMAKGRARLAVPSTTDELIPGEPVLVRLDTLFVTEYRTGIALDLPTRRVRKGHLYAATHVRLQPEVAMLAGLSEALCPKTLDREGIIQLGGERRVARYECLEEKEIAFPTSDPAGRWALTVCAIPWTDFVASGQESAPRASGPLIRMGGWDMKRRFHKDMTAWLPPGTAVYCENRNRLPFGFIFV